VELNTECHQNARCRFSFDKPYVDSVETAARLAFSGMDHSENATPHSSILI